MVFVLLHDKVGVSYLCKKPCFLTLLISVFENLYNLIIDTLYYVKYTIIKLYGVKKHERLKGNNIFEKAS